MILGNILTSSGDHKPHLGLLKIVTLLTTFFINRFSEVVLLLGVVLEGLGPVLESLGRVLVRLVSILGRYWNRLRARVERCFDVLDLLRIVFQAFSGLGSVFDRFLDDFLTPSGSHKPHLGGVKIVILLRTSFKNRLL